MKFSTYLLFFGLCFSILACGSDDTKENSESEEDLRLVAGMELTDWNGIPISTVGNPNESNDGVILFPNPSSDVITIVGNDIFTDIWIVKGTKDTTQLNVDFAAANLSFTESFIAANRVRGGQSNSDTLILGISDLETGYYRYFYKMGNGEIGWKNFYTNQVVPEFQLVDEVLTHWP